MVREKIQEQRAKIANYKESIKRWTKKLKLEQNGRMRKNITFFIDGQKELIRKANIKIKQLGR